MSSSQPRIAIIGGGVSGLTTGIVLQLHGYDTKIYTTKRVTDYNRARLGERPPEFASIQAAASILPHSVNVGHLDGDKLLRVSKEFFHRLAFTGYFGVRRQRHYEVFEESTDLPDFARPEESFRELERQPQREWVHNLSIPMRRGAKDAFGWLFSCFFCEVPHYMRRLADLYDVTGGDTQTGRTYTSLSQICTQLTEDVVINCSGIRSRELFPDDEKNMSIIRGHMIRVASYEVPRDHEGQYFSYNYAPPRDVYPDPDPKNTRGSMDVYFYPRSDGWLLGGSRQSGDISGDFTGDALEDRWSPKHEYEKPSPDAKDHPGVEMIRADDRWRFMVPKPVWELNRELIKNITSTKTDVRRFPSQTYIGYRFGRNQIRIERGNEIDRKNHGDRVLIHNYGHGGAGYTLSWGCAYEVLQIVRDATNSAFDFRAYDTVSSGDESIEFILQDLARDLEAELQREKKILREQRDYRTLS